MSSQPYVFKNIVNSFRYLYNDADLLLQLATKAEGFDKTQLSRTALLLFVLSLEGLINRVMDHFLPPRVHDFIVEREENLSFEDKWLLVPLMVSQIADCQFDTSSYPWSHFAELVRLRNDYVHPKHDRPAYYRALSPHTWEPLDWKRIPVNSGITEKELIYRQTQIPKDPYAVLPEHVVKAKQIVDDMVTKLDAFLGGRLNADKWRHSDSMKLVYPEGAKLTDIPNSDNTRGTTTTNANNASKNQGVA